MRPKNYFYITIIFSGCVIGTPVNFGGMTGRALGVILKLIFGNRAITKKVIFKRIYWNIDGTPCTYGAGAVDET
jgi:hypothetical protein